MNDDMDNVIQPPNPASHNVMSKLHRMSLRGQKDNHVHVVHHLVFHRETHCVPRHCDSGRCCCSVQMMLILGETHTASLRKGGKSVEDRIISISASSEFSRRRMAVDESAGARHTVDGPRIKGNGCNRRIEVNAFLLLFLFLFLRSKAQDADDHLSG